MGVDDPAIARLRMRHLVEWNVTPLPIMHSARGKLGEPPPSNEQRERNRKLALQILAIQIWHTGAKSALAHAD